jgi:hypothetical protein
MYKVFLDYRYNVLCEGSMETTSFQSPIGFCTPPTCPLFISARHKSHKTCVSTRHRRPRICGFLQVLFYTRSRSHGEISCIGKGKLTKALPEGSDHRTAFLDDRKRDALYSLVLVALILSRELHGIGIGALEEGFASGNIVVLLLVLDARSSICSLRQDTRSRPRLV